MKRSKNKILHITPHLGGGVGQVLLNWLVQDKDNVHILAALDFANEKAIQTCDKNGVRLFSDMSKNIFQLLELIEEADIVLVHFWNHPLLWDLLVNTPLPPLRIAFWAHVSGFEPPYVFTEKILNYPDKFLLTTPISFDVDEVRNLENKDKLGSILSTGGVKRLVAQVHDGFNVGYIGTVDFAKMHTEFVKIHKAIDIPDVKFIIVGGDNEKEISKTADDRFNFVGKVADIYPYLAQMDVFGYLLNEKHYGTAEQALQEAMAAGVVPVVLNNPAESFLVKHNETGLVANNLEEYKKYIKLLYDDKVLKERLSQSAKEYAIKNFSLQNLSAQWNEVYEELLKLPKMPRRYANRKYSPVEVFLESIGIHKEPFVVYLQNNDIVLLKTLLNTAQWTSRTKGTPKQYYSFFSEDKNLERICDLYE